MELVVVLDMEEEGARVTLMVGSAMAVMNTVMLISHVN